MNFKIENNYLNISNYPSIERHFEEMASQGWLITKILSDNIFIYKKIQAEKLDFTIAPYEIETAFTRKSKEELDEFQSVCEMVGWNYAIKYSDFYIYFKKEGEEALEIETDGEEEFKTLEKIGKKQITWLYISIVLFSLILWFQVKDIFREVRFLKDGLSHIVEPLILAFVISMIDRLVMTHRFIKRNRENIELGRDIDFDRSKMYIQKITSFIQNVFIVLFVLYILYEIFFLKQMLFIVSFLPLLLIFIIGYIYRRYIKTSKKSLAYKKRFFIVIFIVGFLLLQWLGIESINNMLNRKEEIDIDGLKVMSVNDFGQENMEEEESLYRNFSIFIPESYDYYSLDKDYDSIETEYSRALTEGIAKNLVKRYIEHSKEWSYIIDLTDLEYAFSNEEYDRTFEEYGLSQEEFNKINLNKDREPYEAAEEAMEIMRSNSIRKDKDQLWDMEEVYFLNSLKEEVLIREGKEVFYLRGKDFSDPEIIKIVKDKLDLNK